MSCKRIMSSSCIVLISWSGTALLLIGLCLHPLLEVNDPNSTLEPVKLSLWKINRSNDSSTSWSAYASVSPLPVQIGCSMTILSGILGFLTCLRINKESASTSSFLAILASFTGITAVLCLPVALSVHFIVLKFHFTFWLGVAGASILFISGLFSHYNRESIHSTGTWNFLNLIFAILTLGSTTLLSISASKPTFGSSFDYCINSDSCSEFLPRTSVGLWEYCTYSDVQKRFLCYKWNKDTTKVLETWPLKLIASFIFISLIFSFIACIIKFLRYHLRGLTIGLCCLSLGSGSSALMLMTSFLSSFFASGDIFDFKYTTVYPGEGIFFTIGGILAIFCALTIVTVEPVCTVGGERWKMTTQMTTQKPCLKVSQCDQSYGFFDKSEQIVSQSSTTNTISGLDARKPGEPVRMTLEDLNPDKSCTPIYRKKLDIF